ncbi:putative inner centromere protein [Erysiphe neolycopersici]|uniref:Putative inner centromere protein n=1 Tax=Erysiphe neolycopersici TaxID=212602 RepID=A0A420HZZ0_9PEZI|nr:putative inner centromere protein [Erysiphe neolycopersici]
MTGRRGNRPRAGSPSWISQERSCALQIVQSETEEFTYSVRNEVDWLNEHMAEIFSANQMNVAEIFKTPGKLRGKTPRTLQKNHQFLERPPLSSIFSTLPAESTSDSKDTSHVNPTPNFEVAEDKQVQVKSQLFKASNQKPTAKSKTSDTLSHSEDNRLPSQENYDAPTSEYSSHDSLSTQLTEPDKVLHHSSSDNNKSVIPGGSFHQHRKEIIPLEYTEVCNVQDFSISKKNDVENLKNTLDTISKPFLSNTSSPRLFETNSLPSPQKSSPKSLPEKENPIHSPILQQDLPSSPVTEPIENDMNDVNSQSDGSSPIRLIVRKSSLNFASLPAREPLTTKKSIGNSVSRLSQAEQPRASHLGRKAATKSIGNIANKKDSNGLDLEISELEHEDTDNSMIRIQNKTSTQRLQDQISRLNNFSKDISKSNPANCTVPINLVESNQELVSKNLTILEHVPSEYEDKHLSNNYKNCTVDSIDVLSKHASKSPRPELEALRSISKNKYDNRSDKTYSNTQIYEPESIESSGKILENNVNLVSTPTLNSTQDLEGILTRANNASKLKEINEDLPKQIEISTKPTDKLNHALIEQQETNKEENDKKSIKQTKEDKESNRTNHPLEKVRLKVIGEAHLYKVERERLDNMQVEETCHKLRENQLNASKSDVMRVTRNSPRKIKPLTEAENIDITSSVMDPPKKDTSKIDVYNGVSSSAIRNKSQIGPHDKKRPLKPTRETSKAKPPTVIRVDICSQRGQQYHPSNATLSATLQESLSSQTNTSSQSIKHKASISSIQSKSSFSSFKSAATKAMEAAARKKEKDELAAARKREIKLENERQRTAAKEEERQKEEKKKRQEAEYQAEVQREREKSVKITESKKAASRQAIEKRRLEIEKTKESRKATTVIRNKVTAEPEKVLSVSSKLDSGQSRVQKIQQDTSRIVCTNLTNTTKLPPKRLFQHEVEEQHVRPSVQRNGASIFHNDQHSKRRKTTDSDEDAEFENVRPKMTAPPVRQSGIRYKDMPTKSIFSHGYANNVSSNNLQRSTLISQHNLIQSKPTHPLDMVQLAKGPIPFASISSQGNSQSQKTPAHTTASNVNEKSNARTMIKKTAKSSPKYPNGENIDLPEIHTDSDDDDSDDQPIGVRPGWTDTPEIQKQLEYQEIIDPADVFGQPGPLIMEEVFSKSKDRFHKFRARTSSANWSGTDRLTEDEIQKDLEGRDRVRRQGGWSYDAMV